jgi:succinate dehydrogenase / fumarate reductase membrane anchor subunit
MTSTTATPGRTVRKVKPIPVARNRFEKTAYTFMRYSGLALVFLSLSHFWMQHVIIGTHQITMNDTVLRWGATGEPVTVEQVIWRVYYAVIVVLAMLHGLNGLRQVVYDYFGNNSALYKGLMGVAAVLIGLVSAGGLLALVVGAQRVAEVAMR